MVPYQTRFETFDNSHLVALALFVIGAFAIVWLGRRIRDTPTDRIVSRVLAIAIAVIATVMQILKLLPAEWNLNTSLPLHICDFGWMVAVVALWTHNRLLTTMTFLWGVTLTTQAMITPDLATPFPEPRFLMFWFKHWLIVWAAIFLVLGLNIRPTWRDYRRTVGWTLVWMVGAMTINFIIGTNYGYLNRKPSGASALDLLGPWPLYLVFEILIVATVWALLVWLLSRREAPAE